MQARANLKRQLAAKGQSVEGIRSDVLGVVGSIYKEDGITGFWKGEPGGIRHSAAFRLGWVGQPVLSACLCTPWATECGSNNFAVADMNTPSYVWWHDMYAGTAALCHTVQCLLLTVMMCRVNGLRLRVCLCVQVWLRT